MDDHETPELPAHLLARVERLNEPVLFGLSFVELTEIEAALLTVLDVARWRETGRVSEYLKTRWEPDEAGQLATELEQVNVLLDRVGELRRARLRIGEVVSDAGEVVSDRLTNRRAVRESRTIQRPQNNNGKER